VTDDWTPPTLETERLILRPIVPDDAQAVFQYASNPAVTRFTLFETHRTIDDSRLFTEEYTRTRYANREPDPFGIVLKDNQRQTVVGALGAYWASQPNLTMEFGYSIAEPF
jgi:[ribosomal protein S5]-alanine N-acetyltransferase